MDQKPDNKAFAKMLAKPEGEMGKKVAENLNKSNAYMIEYAIEVLSIKEGDHILEIGFGNGAHIKEILDKGKEIRFTGIEIAETMIGEATSRYSKEIENKQVEIHLASSENIPFAVDSFDKILAANVLYFWENPHIHLQQIYKALKPGGVFCLSYRSKAFLEPLPFVQYGFALYSQKEGEQVFKENGFKILKSEHIKEPLKDFEGVITEPDFIVICATK